VWLSVHSLYQVNASLLAPEKVDHLIVVVYQMIFSECFFELVLKTNDIGIHVLNKNSFQILDERVKLFTA